MNQRSALHQALASRYSVLVICAITLILSINVHSLFAQSANIITSMSWSPDGLRIAIAKSEMPCQYGVISEAVIEIRDSTNLQLISIIPVQVYCSVKSLAWDSTSNKLLGIDLHRVIVWSAISGVELVIGEYRSQAFTSVEWNSNGTLWATGDITGTVVISDATTGQRNQTMAMEGMFVSWDSNSRIASASQYSGEIYLGNAQSGERLASLVGHYGSVSDLDWHSSRNVIASGGWDNVRLWDGNSYQEVGMIEIGSVSDVEWSPDGTHLAIVENFQKVHVWDTIADVVMSSSIYSGRILGLTWNPNGRELLYGGALTAGGESPFTRLIIDNDPNETLTPTATPTDTPAPTATETATPTDTPVEATATASATPTNTPAPTATETATHTTTPDAATATASATPTDTPAPTATETAIPTTTSTLTATPVPPSATPLPSPTPTPTPSGVTSWERVEAESFVEAAPGVFTANTYDPQGGGGEVRDFDAGRWLRFDNVNLGAGVTRWRLRADSPNSGSVSLRVGSEGAAPFCTLSWAGGSVYNTQTTTCSGSASGTVSLFLRNDNVQWINSNWFELEIGGVWYRIETEWFNAAASGAYEAPTYDGQGGALEVRDFDANRWLRFDNVNLLNGVVRFRLRADSPHSGSLSLRIGSPTAAPFCTLSWTGVQVYSSQEVACSVPVSGVQTVYLTNDSVQWINVNWFMIERTG